MAPEVILPGLQGLPEVLLSSLRVLPGELRRTSGSLWRPGRITSEAIFAPGIGSEGLRRPLKKRVSRHRKPWLALRAFFAYAFVVDPCSRKTLKTHCVFKVFLAFGDAPSPRPSASIQCQYNYRPAKIVLTLY